MEPYVRREIATFPITASPLFNPSMQIGHFWAQKPFFHIQGKGKNQLKKPYEGNWSFTSGTAYRTQLLLWLNYYKLHISYILHLHISS